MALSFTPYIFPILVNEFSFINLNNSSFVGLSSGLILKLFLNLEAHDPHLVDFFEISFPQSIQ